MTVNAAGSSPSAPPRAAWAAGLAVLATLLLTVDTRSYGLIPDGKEMLSVSAAVARFGEIGVSRDFSNAPRRRSGDAVSRYGMGLSLVEAIPAALSRAASLERTAPLFVLVPALCLAGCAWAAARALARLGAAPGTAAAYAAGLVLATPLWGYAGSDYGEPLQALCVTVSMLALVELRDAPASRTWQVVLGLAAGWAILTKTLLVLVVGPFLLVAVIPRRGTSEEDFLEGDRADGQSRGDEARAARRRASRELRKANAVAPPRAHLAMSWPLLLSFAGILVLWLVFELSRFGKLGGGYGNETFTYPFLKGLLRLTLLPNKGLLWYAPVVLLAAPGFLAVRRRDARLALALAGSFLVLLLASSAWWAWDGQAGWGPRLVLPALPCLVLLAGAAHASGPRAVRVAGALALAGGAAVNALGALVPFPAIYALSSRIPAQPISETRAAGTEYEIGRTPDGTLVATAPHHLSLTPAWSPIRVHALALAARLKGGWDGSLPELDPPFRPAATTAPAPALRLALDPPLPGIWRSSGAGWADPYWDAIRDQVVRAIDQKKLDRAAALGAELEGFEERRFSSSDPSTAALIAEVIRLGGGVQGEGRAVRASGASAPLSYLSEKCLSPSSSCHPWVLFVRAMAEPPGDYACLPEAERETFARAVAVARQRGWTLTEWNRAALTGKP